MNTIKGNVDKKGIEWSLDVVREDDANQVVLRANGVLVAYLGDNSDGRSRILFNALNDDDMEQLPDDAAEDGEFSHL